MIREEIKQLKTGPRELRNFGLLVGGVFALLAAWCFWKHKPAYVPLAIVAPPLILIGLIYPRGLRVVYIGWMAMAFVLGTVVSTIILTVFFYLIVTPVGLIARCLGKDFLNRTLIPGPASYWMRRGTTPKQKTEFEQQF